MSNLFGARFWLHPITTETYEPPALAKHSQIMWIKQSNDVKFVWGEILAPPNINRNTNLWLWQNTVKLYGLSSQIMSNLFGRDFWVQPRCKALPEVTTERFLGPGQML